MSTINAQTDSLTGVQFALSGGRFRVRLHEGTDNRVGHRTGHVLDDNGEIIGTAHDLIYGSRGWCIDTAAYGGFHPAELVDLVI